MKRTRFTETQIVSILKEADAGAKVKDLCRKHGISDATYYNWKSKYGGMEASDLKRMKELEGELSQYKRMYAELARESDAMRNLIEKTALRPSAKRKAAEFLTREGLSIAASCRCVGLSRSNWCRMTGRFEMPRSSQPWRCWLTVGRAAASGSAGSYCDARVEAGTTSGSTRCTIR